MHQHTKVHTCKHIAYMPFREEDMHVYIYIMSVYLHMYICIHMYVYTHVHTQRGRPAAAGGARRVGVDAEFFAGK